MCLWLRRSWPVNLNAPGGARKRRLLEYALGDTVWRLHNEGKREAFVDNPRSTCRGSALRSRRHEALNCRHKSWRGRVAPGDEAVDQEALPRHVVGEGRACRRCDEAAGCGHDRVAGRQVPLADGEEPWVDVGLALGHPAELER